MPLDLAAVLVEAGAASEAGVERARARQREAGGSLDTALLELGIVSESELLELLARASGLPLAPWPTDPDPRARRVFPARVAERHLLVPLRLEGAELSVAAVHPVDAAVVDELSFMLSLRLVPHVTLEWRARELMARTFGTSVPERFAVLAEAARVRGASAPPAAPPGASDAEAGPAPGHPSHVPRGPPRVIPPIGRAQKAPVPRADPLFEAADLDDLFIVVDEGFEQGATPPPAAPPPVPSLGTEVGPPPPAPVAPTAEASSQPTQVEAAAEPRVERSADPPSDPTLRPQSDAAATSALETTALAAAGPGEPRMLEFDDPRSEEPLASALAAAIEAVDAEALLHLDEGALPGDEAVRWTREAAQAALEAARGRDEIVAIALRYTRSFFEAAALFAIVRQRIRGQDAAGWPGARERCREVEVDLGAASMFGAALENAGPRLGPVEREPGNEAVVGALGRPWPRAALVYPVVLRERVACLVYGDNGDAPVSPARIGDLLLVLGGLAPAFERVLREAKRLRALAAPLPTVSPGPARAAEGEPKATPAPTLPESAPAPPRARWTVLEPARAPEAGLGGGELLAMAEDVLRGGASSGEALERLVALRTHRAFRGVLERLRRAFLDGERPELAALALARLGDVQATPSFIRALPSSEPAASAALEALEILTCRRFGRDAERWQAWWKENRGRRRVDWLFAALEDDDVLVRAAAASALRDAGSPPVRWNPEAQPEERARAARAWRAWWEKQGGPV